MALEGDLRMNGVRFKLDSEENILARRGLETHGRAQKYVDSEVLRRNAPYLAHDSGDYEKRGRLGTEIGSGEVVYNTAKGRFLYYGKVMVGERTGSPFAESNEKKIVTDRDLTYQGGGLRGAYHFERMKADHKDDILKGAAEITGGRAK